MIIIQLSTRLFELKYISKQDDIVKQMYIYFKDKVSCFPLVGIIEDEHWKTNFNNYIIENHRELSKTGVLNLDRLGRPIFFNLITIYV